MAENENKSLLQMCPQHFRFHQPSGQRDGVKWHHLHFQKFHFYELDLSSLPLQLGTFRSQDGDYFIEPLLSMDEQEDEDEQNKPHVIYRLGTAHGEPSTDKHACDTSGIPVFLRQRPTPVTAQRCSSCIG